MKKKKKKDQQTNYRKNAVDAVGKVVSCTTSGTATIEYSDKNYYDIKILDTDLIEWLADNGRSIDNVGIMFSTDEDRNISEIALLTSPFYIMYQEGDTYVAFREDHIIAFTSEIDLAVDSCYEGYFNYPDMNLHSGTTTDCGAYYFFSTPICDEKMSTAEKSVPSGKEVTVYKIRAGSEWYYCSKDTYDELNIGDSMNEYTFTGQSYNYVYFTLGRLSFTHSPPHPVLGFGYTISPLNAFAPFLK